MYITCTVADNFCLRRYIFKQTGLFPENHFHELGDVGDVQIAVAVDVAGGGACGEESDGGEGIVEAGVFSVSLIGAGGHDEAFGSAGEVAARRTTG